MAGTLADVARTAGCSSATVSRVVNGVGQVSTQMRDTVLRAAETVGYQVRPARRLASLAADGSDVGLVDVILHQYSPFERLTHTGGALQVAPLTDSSGSEMIAESNRLSGSFARSIVDGMITEASAWNARVAIRATDNLEDPDLLASVSAPGPNGVVLMGEYSDALDAFATACKRPLVLADLITRVGPPVVSSDNAYGIGLAFDHLTGLGHTAIGLVVGPMLARAAEERSSAFLAKAFAAGLRVRRDWIYEGAPHMAHTEEWAYRLLSKKARPTALLCCNDFLAIAVLRAARRLDMSVPRRLSVVGYDDIEPAVLATPALTTVRVPTGELGSQAIRQLMLMTRGGRNAAGAIVRVTPRLVVRESTASPGRKA